MKIEDCPFCKTDAPYLDQHSQDGDCWFVGCSLECGYNGPDRPTEDEAIDAHNKVAELQTLRLKSLKLSGRDVQAIEWYEWQRARTLELLRELAIVNKAVQRKVRYIKKLKVNQDMALTLLKRLHNMLTLDQKTYCLAWQVEQFLEKKSKPSDILRKVKK